MTDEPQGDDRLRPDCWLALSRRAAELVQRVHPPVPDQGGRVEAREPDTALRADISRFGDDVLKATRT